MPDTTHTGDKTDPVSLLALRDCMDLLQLLVSRSFRGLSDYFAL